MIELTYRLAPHDLVVYRKLAWYHAMRRGEDTGAAWGRFFLLTFAVAVVLAIADVLFPVATGRPFAYPEFLVGFGVGYLVLSTRVWWRYRRFENKAARPDGPTMSEHRISVTADCLQSKSALAEGVYRWPAFTEVTVSSGIVVLWMEPGAGVVVPRAAFGDAPGETAFLQAVGKYMAASGSRGGAVQAPVRS